MYDWASFDIVFQKAPKWIYDQNAIHTISHNRQEMEGILFFDRICASLGLQHTNKLFPPKSNQDLRNLFEAIVNAAAPVHQKHAIIYYLVQDCKPITDNGETFARKVYLPRKYKLFIGGLHHLDQGQANQALELLTDPSLTLTFLDEIMYALLQNPKVDNYLAMAYYVTVSPPLKDQKTLDTYFSFLCDTNITHAYRFCQTRVDSERRSLFERLILSALSARGENTVSRAETLIGLPFTDVEVLWFEDFLLQGKGSSCHGAKDSVIMRRMATGRDHTDLPSLRRFRGQTIEGINWGDMRINF